MKHIKADHDRWLELPGVPGPVRRPVDIDQSQTGFANLRTLRIYRFDAKSVIDGHAEDDEVFLVVMAGSIDITITDNNSEGDSRAFTLSAPGDSQKDGCVAYLPPHSAYQLIPKTDADIAYARATPVRGRPSRVFTPHPALEVDGVTVLFEERTYAQRLRLRLVRIEAEGGDVAFQPISQADGTCEALVHIRMDPAQPLATIATTDAGPTMLASWDSAALAPGTQPNLIIAHGSSALVLVVLAG